MRYHAVHRGRAGTGVRAMGHMDSRAERLLAELIELTGEDGQEALHRALEERMDRVKAATRPLSSRVPEEVRQKRLAAIRQFQEELAKLPVLDDRSADEIIGYNDQGHFD